MVNFLIFISSLLSATFLLSSAQFVELIKNEIRWCCVGTAELTKCLHFATAVDQQIQQFSMALECVESKSKDQCMTMLDEDEADIVSLDAGEIFLGGRYHSLLPIMQERYGTASEQRYYSVAIVKKSQTNIRSLHDLRGRRACFTGVGEMAGWVLPISILIRRGLMHVVDCNNHVKSAAAFFGPSCAVNSLGDKHNPTGDNPNSLCEICAGYGEKRCSGIDPYARYDGSFRCLVSGRADIAFMKHTTVLEMTLNRTLGINKADFELLCPGGDRKPVEQYQMCNWGQVPADAIMASSAATLEMRIRYQSFLQKAVEVFGAPVSMLPPPPPGVFTTPSTVPRKLPPFMTIPTGPFSLFESLRYGEGKNLLVQDVATRLEAIQPEKMNFRDYLGEFEDAILQLRSCPITTMKMCVLSELEMEKCQRMRVALRAQMLKPELVCVKGKSQRMCMALIAEGIADVAMLDAGDVYTAGREFGLVPIMAEQYNLDGPYFYAVAVASIEDKETDLLYVKGKRTCHPAMDSAAGWVLPVAFLLRNDRLRRHGCDGVKSAAEFFEKSCVPGILSPEYNRNHRQNSLCDLCHGSSSSLCERDHSEDFFGFTGAFRCLVEGGGEIAFVKHTTVFENTDGRNKMWWARNMLAVDFELLCRDGSRAMASEFAKCNLGRVPGNALVARSSNYTATDAYVNLFMYAQQFYGSKNDEDFKFQMFHSEFPYTDLIFQDATQQLVPVPLNKRRYLEYLGTEFLAAKRTIDCHASADVAKTTAFVILLSLLTFLIVR